MSTVNMSNEDMEKLADIITTRLDEKRRISEEQHQLDHEWIKPRRERDTAFRGARGRFIEKVVGTVGIAAVLGFLAWFGHAIITTLNDILGRGGPP